MGAAEADSCWPGCNELDAHLQRTRLARVYDRSLVGEGDKSRRGDPCGRPSGQANAGVRGDGTPQGRPLRWLGVVRR